MLIIAGGPCLPKREALADGAAFTVRGETSRRIGNPERSRHWSGRNRTMGYLMAIVTPVGLVAPATLRVTDTAFPAAVLAGMRTFICMTPAISPGAPPA